MRKGITPIISIIILLLITVSLAGAAWTFLQGFLLPQIQKSFVIPPGGSYCIRGAIKVYVVNTGYQSTLVPEDFVVRKVDGVDITLRPVSIQPGDTDLLVDHDCGGGCTSRYYSVELGTSSSIQHLSIFCSQ